MAETLPASLSEVPMPAAIEKALVGGDLKELSPEHRMLLLKRISESIGVNYLTNPFAYIVLNSKLTLYATRACADQLRRNHSVSIAKPEITFEDGMVVVSVTARLPDGREDSELGVVFLGTKQGDDRANLVLKAITKAKRRVTLSICGLGWLDETEVDSIPGAQRVDPDIHPARQSPEHRREAIRRDAPSVHGSADAQRTPAALCQSCSVEIGPNRAKAFSGMGIEPYCQACWDALRTCKCGQVLTNTEAVELLESGGEVVCPKCLGESDLPTLRVLCEKCKQVELPPEYVAHCKATGAPLICEECATDGYEPGSRG